MNRAAFYWAVLLAFTGLLQGCAAFQIKVDGDPRDLARVFCSGRFRGADGVMVMRASNPEFSGRFTAFVKAAPQSTQVEVVNPLGGTEARISVQGSRYRVVIPSRPSAEQSGRDEWAGIPLRWSSELFLGSVPCPKGRKLRFERSGRATVSVTDPKSNEVFDYMLTRLDGKPWVTSFSWTQPDQKISFRVEFSDPDPRNQIARRFKITNGDAVLAARWKRVDRTP